MVKWEEGNGWTCMKAQQGNAHDILVNVYGS